MILTLLFSLILSGVSFSEELTTGAVDDDQAPQPLEKIDESKKEYSEASWDEPLLSVANLCRDYVGKDFKPGKKRPLEVTEEEIVINCYKKGSDKVSQVLFQKQTLERIEQLVFQQQCVASNSRFAGVIGDTRALELDVRFFQKASTPVRLKCEKIIAPKNTSISYKTQTREQIMNQAIIEQNERLKKAKRLKNLIKEGSKKSYDI